MTAPVCSTSAAATKAVHVRSSITSIVEGALFQLCAILTVVRCDVAWCVVVWRSQMGGGAV